VASRLELRYHRAIIMVTKAAGEKTAMKGARRSWSGLLATVAAAVLTLLGLSGAVSAQPASSVFTVANVHVDATAASAIAAREAARLDGQRRAFTTLIERLTLAADRGRVPKQPDTRLTELVRDFEVANERSSAVRYLADYTFRFRAEDIRRLFADNRVPYAETLSKPVVVVPVLRRDGANILWDAPNPWRDAWAGLKSGGGLVPLVLPAGDAPDVAAVGADDAAAAKPDSLAAISGRYGGGDVLIVQATQGDGGQIDMVIRRASGATLTPVSTASFRPNEGEDEAAVMARAAAAGDAELEDSWKHQVLVDLGNEAVLTADVPIDSLGDWLFVRDHLAGIAAVKRSNLLLLGKHAARIEIHYAGDATRLQLALAQHDLALAAAGDGWTLQRRAAALPQ
jgi:hypothetical protein